MKEINARDQVSTSFGIAFLIDDPPELNVGESVLIDGKIYQIKRILLSSRPTENNTVVIFV